MGKRLKVERRIVNGVAEKKCNKCGNFLPLETGFYKDKYQKDGRQSSCKVCMKQVTANYTANNPEKVKQSSTNWRANNPEKVKEYRVNNREKANQASTDWRTNNPERAKQLITNWQANNPEKVSQHNATYRANNPEKILAKNANRRARKKAQDHPDTDPLKVAAIYKEADRRNEAAGLSYGDPDFWCVDHWWPIAGPVVGAGHHGNLRLMTFKNNAKKSDMTPNFWIEHCLGSLTMASVIKHKHQNLLIKRS
jgi:hypothetical protein